MDVLLETPVIADLGALSETSAPVEVALTTDMYRELRARCAAYGLPPEQVAFIHDAKKPAQRQQLFAAVRAGQVRVLVGTSEKMGTGMNVQDRLLAVHQVTPPWRPDGITQQLGRALRQGNLYSEVFQFVYVMEGSFDGYVWQSLETKLGFIEQVDGDYTIREVEDISSEVLTFSEIKALASGNPKIMQKVAIDAELMRLQAVRSAWQNSRRDAEWTINRLKYLISNLPAEIETYANAIAARDALPAPAGFLAELIPDAEADEDTPRLTFTEREAAGLHLRKLRAGLIYRALRTHEATPVGRYKGLTLWAYVAAAAGDKPDKPVYEVTLYFQVSGSRYHVNIGESDAGITLSMDAQLRSLDKALERLQEQLANAQRQQAALEAELALPWEHEEHFRELLNQSLELATELDADAKTTLDLESKLGKADENAAITQSQAQVRAALEAIWALHADPAVLTLFAEAETEAGTTAPVMLPLTSPEDLTVQIETAQAALAQLEFALAVSQTALPQNEIVQLDLFGGFTTPQPTPRRKRRKIFPQARQQLDLFG